MQSDHKRLDDLFEMFQERKDTDQGEARRNFCPFRRGLFTHITWEEEILFPIFEERTGMKDNGRTLVMRAAQPDTRKDKSWRFCHGENGRLLRCSFAKS